MVRFENRGDLTACQNYLSQATKVLREDLLGEKGTWAEEWTGWKKFPQAYLKTAEYGRLLSRIKRSQERSNCLVVIGIGGSFEGAKAVLDFLPSEVKQPVFFAGTGFNIRVNEEILKKIDDCGYNWELLIISKSGTTAEIALAQEFFYKALKAEYGNDANSRITVITGAKGTLRDAAKENGWESFDIPENIGGRYSIFTPCGLFPIGFAGLDIEKFREGACDAINNCIVSSPDNDALNYAIALYEQSVRGKELQYFVTNDTAAGSLLNWLVQLYCESSRKDGTGFFASSDVFSEGLHYNGQGAQESGDLITETMIVVPQPAGDKPIYQKYAKYNNAMVEGTIAAHLDGGVGVQAFYLDQTIYDIGYFMQLNMFACAILCYMVGVNPFDQPGVESYKAKMREIIENS